MTKKLTFQNFADLALSRNHLLLNISDPITPSNGSLTIHCNTCNETFTSTARSYKNSRKTGCTNCKKINTSLFWTGRSRAPLIHVPFSDPKEKVLENKPVKKKSKNILLKIAKAIYFIQEDFKNIKNKEDLVIYLTNNPNSYNNFILDKLQNEHLLLPSTVKERHHIIPKHAGGLDDPWNLIYLSSTDHVKAHELRAEVYKETGDLLCINMRNKNGLSAEEALLMRIKASHKASRDNKTGFNSSVQQSINGKKGGKVQTLNKIAKYREKLSTPVREGLSNGLRFEHQIAKAIYFIL